MAKAFMETTKKMYDVRLTEVEMEMAAFIGAKRRAESRAKDRKQGPGYDEAAAWRNDIEGAAAELAYCKAVGIYWPGSVNSFKGPDCGKKTQIRQTHHLNGSLIVRNKDNPDHFYVLVVGTCPYFKVVGWIRGFDAKKNEYLRAPGGDNPAYFVPQKDLKKDF